MKPEDAASPISFPVDVRRLPQKGFPLVLRPGEPALAALSKAQGLLLVADFRADLLVKSWKRGGIGIKGRVEATVVQECVVTLEPMESRIDEIVEAYFVPEGSMLARDTIEEGELVLSADGPDVPETFDGVTIDAGAVAEEFFGLGIDPYPRKPGAAIARETGPTERQTPFAQLRVLKGRD